MGLLSARSIAALLMLALVACATTQPGAVRRYLDPQTAATITIGQQWLFARERPEVVVNVRDYLALYPVDVNRMGEHRAYVTAHAWSTANADRLPFTTPPQLVIAADDRTFRLVALATEPRSLGIGARVVRARGATSNVWYYAIDREAIAYVAASRRLNAELQLEQRRAPYLPWRDPRPAAAAFVASLERPAGTGR